MNVGKVARREEAFPLAGFSCILSAAGRGLPGARLFIGLHMNSRDSRLFLQFILN